MGSAASSTSKSSSDVLSVTCEEGRDVVDHQVKWVRQIDRKAVRFIRVNILLLGLVLTALSMSETSLIVAIERYTNVYTIFGVAALLGSMVTAAVTFGLTSVESGIDGENIRDTCENPVTEEEMYDRLAMGYSEWIRHNNEYINFNVTAFMVTVILVIDSVILLTTGTILAATTFIGTRYYYIGFVLLLVILYAINKVVYNIDDWVDWYIRN